jgi:alkylation response protein AidB-like acyl-CoA dehydrogenase
VDPGSPNLDGLRYHKICILADADSDGQHIATLLCALFLKHFEPLVAAGHVFVAMPPLFRVDVGKEVHYCLDEAERDLLLVSANTGTSLAVVLVDPDTPGVRIARYRTQDGRSAADVFFKDAKLSASLVLGSGDATPAVERAIERAIAALCAEAVGAMEATNATTIDYTKSRKQFGQAIGRFQALQHRMADMFVQATQARSMSVLATGRLASPDAALRRRDIASAKAYVGKALRFVGQQTVQLHGGMGMADELAVSHYFKRLTMIGQTFGDVGHHVQTVSDAILAEAVPAGDLA